MSSARLKSAKVRAVHTPTAMPSGLGRAVRATLIAAAFAAAAPLNAYAGTDTDTFTVSANVVATCEVIADDLEFGDYNPVTAANLDAATTLSLTCTNGTAYNVALNVGTGTGASTATRYMANAGGTHFLGYTLYRNGGRTQLWGSAIGADTLNGTGSGAAANIDVFGRIQMNQAVPSGEYTDTITVTVSW
jgi:spore coat protein U-like protein